MDKDSAEFARKLNEITQKTVTEKELSDALQQAQNSPSKEIFWILSRMIRLAPKEFIKKNIDQILKATMETRKTSVAATFVSSHFLRRAEEIGCTDAHKWVKKMDFPENPLFAAYVYNILAKPAYGNNLPLLWDLLKIPIPSVQQHSAAAIARAAKSPANFLRRILATISIETAPPEVLPFEMEQPLPSALKRGLILVAMHLTQNYINALEYSRPLVSILSQAPTTKQELETHKQAQKLLAIVMQKQPTSYHSINVYNAALVQDRCGNLQPEFLSAMLSCYGLSCVRKFVNYVARDRWLSRLRKSLQYFAIIAEYAAFLDADLQIEIHTNLINLLEKRPFDKSLIRTVADFLANSTPAESPLLPKFIEIVSNSIHKDVGLAEIRAMCQPKIPPIPHPLRKLMVIPQIETKEQAIQVEVPKRNMVIQCDVQRDIKPKLPPKPQYKSTYVPKRALSNNDPNKPPKKTTVDESSDSDEGEVSIKLDFGDSDDE